MEKEILLKYINQGLSTWKIAEICNMSQPNVRYWLKKFDLKTERVTTKEADTKKCPKCGKIKSLDEFYKSTKSSSYCKDCIKESNKLNRQSVKQQAIDYLGGSCSKCGYNKCNNALEFHHLDPLQKDKDYSNYKGSFSDKLKTELDKCVLLCSNCHKEEHYLPNKNI